MDIVIVTNSINLISKTQIHRGMLRACVRASSLYFRQQRRKLEFCGSNANTKPKTCDSGIRLFVNYHCQKRGRYVCSCLFRIGGTNHTCFRLTRVSASEIFSLITLLKRTNMLILSQAVVYSFAKCLLAINRLVCIYYYSF